jgi:recombinational DNA repair protein (RecF pathway)
MPGPPVLDTAIVVGSLAYGESDRIVRLLLPTRGRLSALARGARGSRRRFQGAVDIGNRIDVEVRKGRGELWSLGAVTLVDARLHVRADHPRLALLAYLCEVAGALATRSTPSPRSSGSSTRRSRCSTTRPAMPTAAFRIGFEAKALTFAGFAPSLQVCVVCGRPLEGPLLCVPTVPRCTPTVRERDRRVCGVGRRRRALPADAAPRSRGPRAAERTGVGVVARDRGAHGARVKSRAFLQQSEEPPAAP